MFLKCQLFNHFLAVVILCVANLPHPFHSQEDLTVLTAEIFCQ